MDILTEQGTCSVCVPVVPQGPQSGGTVAGWVLTVAAEGPAVRGHGAVAEEALPKLQAHPLVETRVLGAGGAGPCLGERHAEGKKEADFWRVFLCSR